MKKSAYCVASILITLPKTVVMFKSNGTLEINTKLVPQSAGKEPTGRLWRRWENIKMVVKSTTSKVANLIHLTHSAAYLMFLWTREGRF
jgi:hypothetical protein